MRMKRYRKPSTDTSDAHEQLSGIGQEKAQNYPHAMQQPLSAPIHIIHERPHFYSEPGPGSQTMQFNSSNLHSHHPQQHMQSHSQHQQNFHAHPHLHQQQNVNQAHPIESPHKAQRTTFFEWYVLTLLRFVPARLARVPRVRHAPWRF